MQTKIQSLIEAGTNTGIGYALSVAVGQIVYPLFGYPVTIVDNMALTAIFVALSLTRSYVIRRWFNKRKRQDVLPYDPDERWFK